MCVYIYIYMCICIYSFFWNGDRYYYFYCHYTIVTTIFLDMGMYTLVEPRKSQIGTKIFDFPQCFGWGKKPELPATGDIKNAGESAAKNSYPVF